MVDIHFIGVAGGRVAMFKQPKGYGTGGFAIHGSLNIYVDPGPGALVKSRMFNESLEDINILFVSHYHIDHFTDAPAMSEGINGYGFEKRATLIASTSVLNGGPKGDGALSDYHKRMFKSIIEAKPGETARVGNVLFKFTKTKHDDPTTVGFVLNMDGKSIGYTSDTTYFDDLPNQFSSNLDILIMNVTQIHRRFPKHLCFDEAISLIQKTKPKRAYFYHIGMDFIRSNQKEMEEKCKSLTGIDCRIGKDNDVVNV